MAIMTKGEGGAEAAFLPFVLLAAIERLMGEWSGVGAAQIGRQGRE